MSVTILKGNQAQFDSLLAAMELKTATSTATERKIAQLAGLLISQNVTTCASDTITANRIGNKYDVSVIVL
jgi:hypothetical protein